MKFNLTYISLAVDLTMYKPSTVAAAIEYMLDNATANDNIRDNHTGVTKNEVADICSKIIMMTEKYVVSSLKNGANIAKDILTHLKKECPVKMQGWAAASKPTPTLKYKKQLKPFEGYTKLGSVGAGVGGDVFKVLKDKSHYVVKRGDIEELASSSIVVACFKSIHFKARRNNSR